MKNIIRILLLLITVLAACKNKNNFVINGKFENAKDLKTVLLYQQDKAVDSAILNENHEFKFTVISPDPEFYYIAAGEKSYPLIAQNGDELDFNADYMNATGDYNLKGAEAAEKVETFNKIKTRYSSVLNGIQQEYQQKVSKNPALKDSLEAVLSPRFETNMAEFAKETIAFAESNKENLAGFYAIKSLDAAKYEADLIKYADGIKAKFAGNKDVQQFVVQMDKLKALSVGYVAPDFQITSFDGKQITLSQFRGQYVLLDFWASWCAPCRAENPNLVKQYNTFKNKNFTILSVSLDDTRDKWLSAIKKDNLLWNNHASELKQWDSKIVKLYQIEGIPTSYLLDKEGKIIAKNLRGAELEILLTKTLK